MHTFVLIAQPRTKSGIRNRRSSDTDSHRFRQNSHYIDTVTTNGFYGTFSKALTSPKEGICMIAASFAGDASYGKLFAATGRHFHKFSQAEQCFYGEFKR
jgi:hypothetical protein